MNRQLLGVFLTVAALGVPAPAAADEPVRGACQDPDARVAYAEGFAHQSVKRTDEALRAYARCLEYEPECVACQYEIGWSYWKKARWDKVVYHFKNALRLDPEHPDAREFFEVAKENLALVAGQHRSQGFRIGTRIGTRSVPEQGPVKMVLAARFQAYDDRPDSVFDRFDPDVDSPKSVAFHPRRDLAYVQSLEAYKTLVINLRTLQKVAAISHQIEARHGPLFDKLLPPGYAFPSRIERPNEFSGKPVEAEFSHLGRYLWVSYYRRSYDRRAVLPSAVVVIDTNSNEIVRLIPTGPIPKHIRASHNGKWMAISTWGDNTVQLIDISGDNPETFRTRGWLVVERRLPKSEMHGNRDKNCGFCIRGTAFTADDRYLLVGRMKKGAISIFDLALPPEDSYLGSIFGLCRGPRDLEVAPGVDGSGTLFISCNSTGYLTRVPVSRLISALEVSGRGSVTLPLLDPAVRRVYVGVGARSMRLSPDLRHAFVAVNGTSEIVAVDANDMQIESRVAVDSYPVGLDVTGDGTQLWTTSQAHAGRGGNSINVYLLRYPRREEISGPSSIEALD